MTIEEAALLKPGDEVLIKAKVEKVDIDGSYAAITASIDISKRMLKMVTLPTHLFERREVDDGR